MKKMLLLASSLLMSTTAWLQLSGTVTIDPAGAQGGPNYQTFTEFVDSLEAQGVSAAVTVNVKEGTYTESLEFYGFAGASAANMVTIQPDPTNTNPVLLTHSSTGTGATDATMYFSGASFITFDGIDIENTGASYSRIVYIASGCGDLTFKNNDFLNTPQTGTTSTFYTSVYGTGVSPTGGFTFDGNTFSNGTHGIYITASTTQRNPKMTITNNTVTDLSAYAFYMTYVDSAVVTNNEVHQASSSSTSYGVRLFNSTSSNGSHYIIENNVFDFSTSSTFYGIYMNYTGASAGDPSRIRNNMISNNSTGSTSTRYGLYLQGNGNLLIDHNSISIQDGSTSFGRAVYMTGTTSTALSFTQGGYRFTNNIVANTGGGIVMEYTSTASGHLDSLDYNLYSFGNSTTPFEINNTAYDFAGWQTNSSGDANTLVGDPLFQGNTDLHVVGTLANDAGVSTGLATDIDGDPRNTTLGQPVDIGADEYTPSSCIPPTDLVVSAISFDQVDLGWTVNGTETEWEVEVVTAGATPTGSGTVVTSNPYTFTGLTGQTDYDFYVRAICGAGDSSAFTGPFMFTTACSPVIAPWLEDFTTTVTPPCWSQESTSGGPWEFDGDPDYDVANSPDHTNGTQGNYAYVDYSGTDAGVILQTPLIDVSALNVPELRFWIKSHYTGTLSPYNLTYIEAFDGTDWQQIGLVQGEFGNQWVEFNIIIQPAYIYGANLVNIRFRGESGGASGDFNNDILLDDVSVTEAPTCPDPIDFTYVGADTSSAIFTWTSTGSETEWKIEWGPVGFTPGTGTSELTTTNPDTIFGLTPNTYYDVYIYAVCSPGDTSVAEGPVFFNTFDQGQYMEYDAECGPGFIDITNTGTNLMLTYYQEEPLYLPFPWLVQGEPVNTLTCGNNGAVLFNTINGQVGATMTNTPGLYLFTQALDNDIAGVDQVGVLWETIGTAPNRQYVIMWKDRTHSPGTTNLNPCTFELIFDEATNEIYFIYEDVDFGNPNFDNGADAEIGVRGNQDIDVSINSDAYLLENSCVHFYYTDCPKAEDLILAYVNTEEAGLSWTPGLSSETEWQVVYGASGFDPTTAGTSLSTTNPTIVLSNLTQLTDYDVYVYALCANGDTSFAISTSFTTLPLCSDVMSLAAQTEIDSLIASWSWSPSGPGFDITGFDTYYGSPGFDPTTEGTLYNGDTLFNGDTIHDASFMAGGVYEMYVQAICDIYESNLVGPITFVMPLSNDTACGAQELPVDNTPYYFNNDGATIDVGETSIAPSQTGLQQTDGWGDNNIDFTTWFKFTAPASGQVRISGLEADFDGQVALYQVSDCGDYGTFQLLAANDNDLDGSSSAPNFSFCGLTAGAEYYLMHDSYSQSQTGVYSLKIKDLNLEAGNDNGLFNICSKDTINLFDNLSGYDQGGFWVDVQNTFHIVDDSLFSTNGLAYQVYTFEYRLEDGCASDSIRAQYEVYPPSMAGDDGALTLCKNEPSGLFGALGGVFNAGGTWFDTNGDTTESNIGAGQLAFAGSYNFLYSVGNGVCPDDSSVVTVTVLNSCDWLGVDDLESASLTVYPNPTNGVLTIEYSDYLNVNEVELLDMNGKVVASKLVSNNELQTTLDISSNSNGVYLVRIKSDDFTVHRRVVKQ